jgi:FkbM family methyltransferase
MLYNRHDLYIGRSLDLYGEWGQPELTLLSLLLQPGDVVIDVGANIGTHTVFVAQKVGPAGRVFAFEPQRIVFQMLCANVALGGHNNVHTVNAGLSRQPGTLLLPALTYDQAANYGNVRLSRTNDGESTAIMTLDQMPLERCQLLKIDVEGMELEVLEGGKALIERTKPVVYVENNDPNKSPALIRHLLELNYHLFWHFSRFYSPANFALVTTSRPDRQKVIELRLKPPVSSNSSRIC